MNEGRLFLYVSPNVALPLFFIAIVLAALLVHASILSNTTWFAGYWQGSAGVEMAPAAAMVEEAAVVEAAPAEAMAAEAAPAAAPAAE